MTELEFLQKYKDKEADLAYKRRKSDSMINSLRTLNGLLSTQAEIVRSEKRDVEDLSKLSLANLFNRITSKMDDVTQKEEQDYFEAKVKYDELQNSVALTEKDLNELQAEITSLERELCNMKESGRRHFAQINEKFMKNEYEVIRLKSEVKELNEAITSGKRVCSAIDAAMGKLKKARGWATYDMFSKRGLISHMAKYGNIDDAQEIIREISHLIDIFQSELRDVNIAFQGNISDYNGTTRFVDFFFDNIFTDLSVRNRITDDIDRLNHLQKQIESIINKLAQAKNNALKQISEYE